MGHTPSYSVVFYLETFAWHDSSSLFCNDELWLQVRHTLMQLVCHHDTLLNTIVLSKGKSFLLSARSLNHPVLVHSIWHYTSIGTAIILQNMVCKCLWAFYIMFFKLSFRLFEILLATMCLSSQIRSSLDIVILILAIIINNNLRYH